MHSQNSYFEVPTYLGEICPTNAQGRCKQFFIMLNKLPRHVSSSKCHLQGAAEQMAAPSEQ
jgi:hypothetical protein